MKRDTFEYLEKWSNVLRHFGWAAIFVLVGMMYTVVLFMIGFSYCHLLHLAGKLK